MEESGADPDPVRRRAAEIAGWIGSGFIVLAYGLISADLVDNGWEFQALNLFGALGLISSCYQQRAWPAMTLNVFWAIVSVCALTAFALR